MKDHTLKFITVKLLNTYTQMILHTCYMCPCRRKNEIIVTN